MYACGVFFMSVIVSHLSSIEYSSFQTDQETADLVTSLNTSFGSMYKSMCLLFEGISGGGDWGDLAGGLKDVGEVPYICFALYVVFTTLGVLNIVTGFFVEGTMQASAIAKDEMLKLAHDKKTAMIELIGDLFHELDTDKSGLLSWEELEGHLYDEALQNYFCVLEMEHDEAKDVFRLLDIHGTGEINIDDFTNGCLRIMGSPKNLDICTCLYQGQKIMVLLEKLVKANVDIQMKKQ